MRGAISDTGPRTTLTKTDSEPQSTAADAAQIALATAPDRDTLPGHATIKTLLAGAQNYLSPDILGFATHNNEDSGEPSTERVWSL